MSKSDYELIGMLSVLIDYVMKHKECMKQYSADNPIDAVPADELLQKLVLMKEGVIIGIETDT